MRKTSLYCLLSAVSGMGSAAFGQTIPPNSSYFSVERFYYPGPTGDILDYRVAGFVQPEAPGIKPKIFLLPTVAISSADIRYYDTNGIGFDPKSAKEKKAGSVTITPRVSMTMPNAMQKIAIASQIKGQSLIAYAIPAFKYGGAPPIPSMVAAVPPLVNLITSAYAARDKLVAEQAQIAAEYDKYQPINSYPQETEVRLLIGGDVAASRSYPGSLTTLGAMTLMNPTEFQKNQLTAGAFEIEVRARFPDAQVAFINANFDAKQAVSNFVEETQEAITKSKASGFQVFHIGSRRNKMKTSLNSSMKSDTTVAAMQNTTVVMYDATDSMIKQFESEFFPDLQKQEVIDQHLAAAAEATTSGNLPLAKVHQDYADGIAKSNELKEVDAVAAAAALSQSDYAGFIAQGVRSINSNDRKENSFRRVVSSNLEISQKTSWNQTRLVSMLRETTIPVAVDKDDPRTPGIGICDLGMNVPYTWVEQNIYGGPQFKPMNGIMVTCVTEGSPAVAAGLLPGSLIRAVGAKAVNTPAEFDKEVDKFDAGDDLPIWVLGPATPFSTEKMIKIHSVRGGPRS
jgi:hypothetical protein